MLCSASSLENKGPVNREHKTSEQSKDVVEALSLLKDVPVICSNVTDTIQKVLSRLQNDELGTAKGLSFLDLKNYMFLNYMMNINYLILQKLSGKNIENDPTIDRLVELRIVLERMKPIDEKLKYQVDKLLSAVEHGNFDESNPLRFRAKPENLSVEDENSGPIKQFEASLDYNVRGKELKNRYPEFPKELGESENEASRGEKRSNAYVPPKISAAYYDEDLTIEERKQKILQKSKKRAFSNSILHELRKEYDMGPEEIKETVDPYKIKLNEEIKERTRYEEEFMTRLPLTKKHRHEARQMTTVTNFDMKFGNISALDMDTNDVSLKRKSSGKKGKFSRKVGKKKGKKRKY